MQTATTPSQAPQTRRKLTDAEVAAIQRPAYTPSEVAAVLRLHPTYARLLFTRGLIPGSVRIGSRWILPAPALDQILEQGLAVSSRKGGAR